MEEEGRAVKEEMKWEKVMILIDLGIETTDKIMEEIIIVIINIMIKGTIEVEVEIGVEAEVEVGAKAIINI